MIAYNTDWLSNLADRDAADAAFAEGTISKDEKIAVYNAYPVGFYTPNIFVRVGLFLLTLVIAGFSTGLFSMFFIFSANHPEMQFTILCIVFAIAQFVVLELMIKKGHYRSGVDDALMWGCGFALLGGINSSGSVPGEYNALLIMLVAIVFFIRFVNGLMAVLAVLAFGSFVFLLMLDVGPVARAFLPFVLMGLSALFYLLSVSMGRQENLRLYWRGFRMVRVVALVCFALAGNYYVVREASASLLGMNFAPGTGIPFGWLFWIFTVGIPVIYIYVGLKRKDREMLVVGLLLIAVTVFTVRFYYHVLPPETAMLMGGILLVLLAYFTMKYLRVPRNGFTAAADKTINKRATAHLESLIIAQTFSGPAAPTDSGVQFGGGSGGGGGAGADF
jgi:hypothetical protein